MIGQTPPRAQAAAFVREALSTWRDCKGVGLIDLPVPPVVHPIAEARFLSGTVAALEQDLIDAAEARNLITASVKRLEACAMRAGTGDAWGLNFVHPATGAPATDVDVVTTAWVALGLDAIVAIDSTATALRDQAGAALAEWPDAAGAARLPRMWSRRAEPPVVNAAALRALALHRLGRAEPVPMEAALAFIRDNRLARRGWDFAPGRRSVDMVHSAYVIQALVVLERSPDVERGALEMLNSLRVRGQYRHRLRTRRPAVVEDALAEPRDLGEALVACADLAPRAPVEIAAALTTHVRLLGAAALDRFGDAGALRGPADHPRIKDLAHLTVGLARALPMLLSE